MNTPICDYVRRYCEHDSVRLHMPGHKGKKLLGMEHLDITEIDGADSLYEATGIIRESEQNAGMLFGSETYYSTEGCSQCIRAMLYLTALYAKQCEKKPLIAAARNVHKTFLSAAALLDLDVMWLYPKEPDSYLSCCLDAGELDAVLSVAPEKPIAVYLTSPDYLGNMADLPKISAVCQRHQVLLLVDNAHGAYLRFLQPSMHPVDLGADICCDSAHKTLPALTGAAYLHIAESAPKCFSEQAKNALMLFGSTSPSYLILQSLDAVNEYLDNGYPQRLKDFAEQFRALKSRLTAYGYDLQGDEPLKLTIRTKPWGYRGTELAQILSQKKLVCEFSDPDFLVMMVTPETTQEELIKLEQALCAIPKRPAILEEPPQFVTCERILSIREAVLSPCEIVPVENCVGRVLAAASVGCPPAVPIAVSGERLDAHAKACFSYYGQKTCSVVIL